MLINKRGGSYFILLHSSRLLKRKYLSYPAIPISPGIIRIINLDIDLFKHGTSSRPEKNIWIAKNKIPTIKKPLGFFGILSF